MFDDGAGGDDKVAVLSSGAGGITAEVVSGWVDELATGGLPAGDEARIEVLTALEHLTNAARSAQARTTVAFDASQRARQAAEGVPARRRGRSITGQVALAREISPFRGQQLHGLALVLDRELPCTAAAMRQGRLSEWRAQIIARETAALSAEHRGLVDAAVAGEVDLLAQRGDRELAAECARMAAQLDPVNVAARRRRAEKQRRVSVRPAPDTMSRLSALLPVADGVAIQVSLGLAADAARARGDERSRGQVMADTLVERILGRRAHSTGPADAGSSRTDAGHARTPRMDLPGTESPGTASPGTASRDVGTADSTGAGQARAGITWAECDMDRTSADTAPSWTAPSGTAPSGTAQTPDPARPGVMLNLTMTETQLLRGADGAAWLEGYGPIDAELAREIVREYDTWVRRLHTDPATGGLVSMESGSRYFPARLKQQIRLRDQQCRTPWCDAPVRHVDHVRSRGARGPTSYANGQGLCENCNYTKQAPGWDAIMDTGTGPPGTGDVVTTTPTGHRHRSPVPRQPGPLPAPRHHRLWSEFPAIDYFVARQPAA